MKGGRERRKRNNKKRMDRKGEHRQTVRQLRPTSEQATLTALDWIYGALYRLHPHTEV